MKTTAKTESDEHPETTEPAREPMLAWRFGSEFVDEVIQSLIELDAEHLQALAVAAERFRRDAALQMTPGELVNMEAKMQLFSAVLTETRRNLRILAPGMNQVWEYGSKQGRGPWGD
jgi:hypothetical protein